MKMKKITIASLAIGTMLSITACNTSTEKDQVKKEQTNAQEEAKTTNADETSTMKNDEKETNTSTNEKTEKDQKNSKESSGTESSAKTTNEKTKEKETSTKTTDQATNGKTETKDTNKGVAVKTNVKAVAQLIDSLDKQLAANPKLDTVNKLGKQINEKWDVIEKELEATHPTDYKTIGQSMYPLIVAAEKEKIDVKRIKSLTTKTKQDLNQLLNKLS
ncbi:hypothetical protein COM13_09865 [Bacillus pseudomycoides]|uniref:hypothetical protein n=1 Tax=Bacillus TaxID=1386 RepID=UPI0001A13E58|nr:MULTISPECIES: hypothetical protein [Bacillus]AIK39378.1 hypothetical protein DJ92_305 [Bacillus pseudomycoides]AJI18879.1 hypothetical protein BG07_4629 [Bacillus pseudomycoides]EEM16416.1 hypothetical protein bpmyx0001_28050 [Bacillus pseudomycoides DSM 12442]MCX2824425.1 hypothetical protein [Bacillus sp. DHT2]MDR4915838.1 hypothetical protein [Bacillus pseudomycoides]